MILRIRLISNGTVTGETANKTGFGLSGGVKGSGDSWYVENAMIINYMSCHDNLTLWDKLALSCPDATAEERLAMNRLGEDRPWPGTEGTVLLGSEDKLTARSVILILLTP